MLAEASSSTAICPVLTAGTVIERTRQREDQQRQNDQLQEQQQIAAQALPGRVGLAVLQQAAARERCWRR